MTTFYHSTRSRNESLTSKQAILEGIAPDGGLFVRDDVAEGAPSLESLLAGTYQDRARLVLGHLLDDFTAEEISGCVDAAYGPNFDSPAVTPVVPCGNDWTLELWHGPTSAFKDIALQMLPQLMRVSREGDGRGVMIVTATSGDTGKAALEGFRDVDGTGIAVFYPVDGVSQIQRLQMATQQGSNVAVQAVEGNFDDCQTGVKHLFAKEQLAERLGEQKMYLTSANSINWGRLLPQIVYYFSAYADLAASGEIQVGDKLNVAVPTGNFGNILACYYAKRMGLPIGRLICASNRNDVLTEFLTTGTYNRKREFHLTNTPSMDILISSNLERYLFELFGREARAVAYCMYRLNEGGEYSVTAEALDQIREEFAAYSCDDQKTLDTIQEIHDRCGYVMDTHTAVAVNALEQ